MVVRADLQNPGVTKFQHKHSIMKAHIHILQ